MKTYLFVWIFESGRDSESDLVGLTAVQDDKMVMRMMLMMVMMVTMMMVMMVTTMIMMMTMALTTFEDDKMMKNWMQR